MALNLFEELDLTSTGDDVPEGFLKCKNNWSFLDTLMPGYFSRSIFSWKDADEIYIGSGAYMVNGTPALINTTLTSPANVLTGTKFLYLYITYANIPATGILDNGDLAWSATAPTWSDTKLGYYNSNDRCIFAAYMASDEFLSFTHIGNFVQYASGVVTSVAGTQLTTSLAAIALTVPNLGIVQAQISCNAYYIDAAGYLEAVPGDLSGSTELRLGYVWEESDGDCTVANIITDSSQQIKVKESDASTNTYIIRTNGWYMPEGI